MIKNGLKAVGSFAKDVLEVVSPFVIAGVLFGKPTENKSIIKYNDVIKVVMNSSLWSADKTKVVEALPMDGSPELYKAVIYVINSTLWSEDKVKLILKLCNQLEEA